MKVEIRSDDSIILQGYANVPGKKSRELRNIKGKFTEVVREGVFKKALERNDDVKMLLNHDKDHELASQKAGNLEIREDNVGLYVKAHISDKKAVEMARKGELRSWSFGFHCNDCDWVEEDGGEVRYLNDIDLSEVSILSADKMSAYFATSIVEIRGESDLLIEHRATDSEIEVEIQDDAVEARQLDHYSYVKTKLKLEKEKGCF